jgi:BirA family transcriptional regulator, biotin operon repressor / biotin---[acetyl-CoA-carboxylase] ligase
LPQPPATNPIGSPFIELQSVDSTNNYALGLIHAGLALHGTAVFAHEQLAGKGQRGRVWSTEKNANIILSILLDPTLLPLAEQFKLSMCSALAIHEFFMNYAGEATRIKWPNDLYWQDRKAGGILIESVVGSRESGIHGSQTLIVSQELEIENWKWAVVGTGININQTHFPGELQNPVSLKQITGKNYDSLVLSKEICGLMEKYFRQLINGGFDKIYEQYNAVLYKKNEKVKLKKGARVFEATIKSVLPTGKLLVQHSLEEEFDFGEVEWVIH